jgi:hypothetical protein
MAALWLSQGLHDGVLQDEFLVARFAQNNCQQMPDMARGSIVRLMHACVQLASLSNVPSCKCNKALYLYTV